MMKQRGKRELSELNAGVQQKIQGKNPQRKLKVWPEMGEASQESETCGSQGLAGKTECWLLLRIRRKQIKHCPLHLTTGSLAVLLSTLLMEL